MRMKKSENPTEMRLIHANNMWRSFRRERNEHAPCRGFPKLAHEKQSSFPPARCRSEWHDSVYVVSKMMLTSRTSVPTPIPNFPSHQNASYASFHKNARKIMAR